MNVLFVCTGNTCRSPMAEGFLNHIANTKKLDIIASSAGLYVPGGSFVSDNSVKTMLEFGIDISKHVPKQLNAELIKSADIIITMTEYQKNTIINLLPEFSSKVYTLMDIGETTEVVDPFGSGIEMYKQCADLIYSGVKDFLNKII